MKVLIVFILILTIINTLFVFLQIYMYSSQIFNTLLNKNQRFKFMGFKKGRF